jgi:hypothetical protein
MGVRCRGWGDFIRRETRGSGMFYQKTLSKLGYLYAGLVRSHDGSMGQ